VTNGERRARSRQLAWRRRAWSSERRCEPYRRLHRLLNSGGVASRIRAAAHIFSPSPALLDPRFSPAAPTPGAYKSAPSTSSSTHARAIVACLCVMCFSARFRARSRPHLIRSFHFHMCISKGNSNSRGKPRRESSGTVR